MGGDCPKRLSILVRIRTYACTGKRILWCALGFTQYEHGLVGQKQTILEIYALD